MHYTREPIIETIITPREGYKLAVRSSRPGGQEEYLVEALEVVSFNTALFFRSVERPKCFLLPVTDYEVVEVRETRMVLKHATPEEKSVRPTPSKPAPAVAETEEEKGEKRNRRRRGRRRSGGELPGEEGEPVVAEEGSFEKEEELPPSEAPKPKQARGEDWVAPTLLPPPPQLISETIDRYKSAMSIEPVAEGAPLEEEEVDWEELRLPAPEPLVPTEKEEPRRGLFASSRLLQRLTGQDKFSALPPSDEEGTPKNRDDE